MNLKEYSYKIKCDKNSKLLEKIYSIKKLHAIKKDVNITKSNLNIKIFKRL